MKVFTNWRDRLRAWFARWNEQRKCRHLWEPVYHSYRCVHCDKWRHD